MRRRHDRAAGYRLVGLLLIAAALIGVLLIALVIVRAVAPISKAGATPPPYIIEPGVTHIDPAMQVRAIAGSPAWLEADIDQALATLNQATGGHWTHGPDVPWDGATPIATVQLPEPADQAWLFVQSPATTAGNPGWPGGDWSTWAVFEGLVDGQITRDLTELSPASPYEWIVLHELTHVAGLDDDPGSGGVMASAGVDEYTPGELAGLAALAGHPLHVAQQATPATSSSRPAPATTAAPRLPRPSAPRPQAFTPASLPRGPDPMLAALRLLNQEDGL